MNNVINFKTIRQERGLIEPDEEEFPLSHWKPNADTGVLERSGMSREAARNAFLLKQAGLLRQLRENAVTFNECTLDDWCRLLEIELAAAREEKTSVGSN
jgi:hypothetical protein